MKWTESVPLIVDNIAATYDLEWDTDTNLSILVDFIEEHCNQQEFERFVLARAFEDQLNSLTDN